MMMCYVLARDHIKGEYIYCCLSSLCIGVVDWLQQSKQEEIRDALTLRSKRGSPSVEEKIPNYEKDRPKKLFGIVMLVARCGRM